MYIFLNFFLQHVAEERWEFGGHLNYTHESRDESIQKYCVRRYTRIPYTQKHNVYVRRSVHIPFNNKTRNEKNSKNVFTITVLHINMYVYL